VWTEGSIQLSESPVVAQPPSARAAARNASESVLVFIVSSWSWLRFAHYATLPSRIFREQERAASPSRASGPAVFVRRVDRTLLRRLRPLRADRRANGRARAGERAWLELHARA